MLTKAVVRNIVKTNAKVKQVETMRDFFLLCLLQSSIVSFKSMFSFIEYQIVLLRMMFLLQVGESHFL